MKKFIFFAIIFSSHLQLFGQCDEFFNQLEFTVNQEDNSFTINFLPECNPCLHEDGGESCQCHAICDLISDDCFENCRENFTGIIDVANCVDACRAEEQSCKANCGELVPRSKEIIRVQYSWKFWVTNDLTETMDGNPNSAGVLVYTDDKINDDGITLFSPQNPIPQGGISYCWQTITWFTYDDGSCCIFVDSDCAQRG